MTNSGAGKAFKAAVDLRAVRARSGEIVETGVRLTRFIALRPEAILIDGTDPSCWEILSMRVGGLEQINFCGGDLRIAAFNEFVRLGHVGRADNSTSGRALTPATCQADMDIKLLLRWRGKGEVLFEGKIFGLAAEATPSA
jgi:hypothetical protein